MLWKRKLCEHGCRGYSVVASQYTAIRHSSTPHTAPHTNDRTLLREKREEVLETLTARGTGARLARRDSRMGGTGSTVTGLTGAAAGSSVQNSAIASGTG